MLRNALQIPLSGSGPLPQLPGELLLLGSQRALPRNCHGRQGLKSLSPEAALVECQSTKAWPPHPLRHFETSLKASPSRRPPSLRNLLGLLFATELHVSLCPILLHSGLH